MKLVAVTVAVCIFGVGIGGVLWLAGYAAWQVVLFRREQKRQDVTNASDG